jgi:CBS domain-containing protein
MTAEPIVVRPHATLEIAELLMSEHGIHHLPVVDAGRPIGVLRARETARIAVP